MPFLFVQLRLRETNVGQVAELFVDHDSEDPYHGSTSVVELDGPLAALPLVGLHVPPEIDDTVPVVPRKLGGPLQIRHKKGQEPDRPQRQGERPPDLPQESIQFVNGLEAKGRVLHAREPGSRGGHQPAADGQHADPAVAELDLPQVVKVLAVTVRGQTDGIPVPVGGGGTKVVHEGGGCIQRSRRAVAAVAATDAAWRGGKAGRFESR